MQGGCLPVMIGIITPTNRVKQPQLLGKNILMISNNDDASFKKSPKTIKGWLRQKPFFFLRNILEPFMLTQRILPDS